MHVKQFTRALDATKKHAMIYKFKAKMQLDNMHLMHISIENYKPMKMETNFRMGLSTELCINSLETNTSNACKKLEKYNG